MSPVAGTRSLAALEARHEETTAGKLTVLSIGEEVPPAIREALERLAGLPYVESVLALPDVHWKDGMEVPSSIAVTTRGVIVPELTSVDVNDGMGVVKTGLREDEMSADRLAAFFRSANASSAAHFFDANRYSISASDLRRVLAEGAGALLGRYALEPAVLERMENRGRAPMEVAGSPLAEVVPLALLHTPFSRCEMGLNFGGNHFLEVQVVDELLDREIGARWGFERGQVVVMYHLGPGPFGGTLLNHYGDREKLQTIRRPLFFASKLLLHYGQRMGRGDAAKKWRLYFRRSHWTPLPADAEEGRLLRQALAMAINYGYAYRLATVRAIRDGLHQGISPGLPCELFCDISHNGMVEGDARVGHAWVARHNACRLEPGKPTLVAGAVDVPSYLGIGEGGGERGLHSYDHGAGQLIKGYRDAGRLTPASGRVACFRMTRGRRARAPSREEVVVRTAEPIDRLMRCLEDHGLMRPVVRLRPLGNLRN